MKDGGNKVTLYTPEMSVADRTTLFEFAKTRTAFMAMADAAVEDIEVPETIPEVKGDKTPSQRLRACFYRLWEQQGKPMSGFAVYYETQIEKLIDQVKAKLE